MSIIGSFIGGSVLHIPLCFQSTVVSKCSQVVNTTAALAAATNGPTAVAAASTVPCTALGQCGGQEHMNGELSSAAGGSRVNTTANATSCIWVAQENFAVSENMVFKVF